MHKVIHIIHMEKHVDELIYIMGIETDVLVNNDKNTKIDKNQQISIDIFNVKI